MAINNLICLIDYLGSDSGSPRIKIIDNNKVSYLQAFPDGEKLANDSEWSGSIQDRLNKLNNAIKANVETLNDYYDAVVKYDSGVSMSNDTCQIIEDAAFQIGNYWDTPNILYLGNQEDEAFSYIETIRADIGKNDISINASGDIYIKEAKIQGYASSSQPGIMTAENMSNLNNLWTNGVRSVDTTATTSGIKLNSSNDKKLSISVTPGAFNNTADTNKVATVGAIESYVTNKISSLGTVLNFKGAVSTYNDLPQANANSQGDVYLVLNVVDTAEKNVEYVWIKKSNNTYTWEKLGATYALASREKYGQVLIGDNIKIVEIPGRGESTGQIYYPVNGDKLTNILPDDFNDQDYDSEDNLNKLVDVKFLNQRSLVSRLYQYNELKALRDANELVIGKQYRLYYYCTVTPYNSDIRVYNEESNDLKYILLLTAISYNKFSDDVKVIEVIDGLSNRSYNCSAWTVKYSLDPDNSLYSWVNENCEGVIYYMKDEFDNEAYYDFKNIQMRNVCCNDNIWRFTFWDANMPNKDMSVTSLCTNNKIYYRNQYAYSTPSFSLQTSITNSNDLLYDLDERSAGCHGITILNSNDCAIKSSDVTIINSFNIDTTNINKEVEYITIKNSKRINLYTEKRTEDPIRVIIHNVDIENISYSTTINITLDNDSSSSNSSRYFKIRPLSESTLYI